MKHLYPPGPHRGIFNPDGIRNAEEVILCEAVFDALTFCRAGFLNTTCTFGTEGFTDELWEALRKVQRVKLAYDADDAGERAAQRDAERFREHGVEVFRVKFPHGLDANEYAQVLADGHHADKSLALLLNSAVWLGKGSAGGSPAAVGDPPTASPGSSRREEAQTEAAPHPGPLPAHSSRGEGEKIAPASSSLAASVSRLKPDAAKEEKPPEASAIGVHQRSLAVQTPSLEQRGDAWFMDIEGREYRVAGLEKTLGTDALKVALRLRVGERFHLDQVDLTRDGERRKFIERAAEETGLTNDLLKRDVARLLLAVEQAQAELAKPTENVAAAVTLTPEEREAALTWLREPNLIARLREAFHQAGIIGEETNTLVAYLAGVSRKLERPLAIIIQSASAAGKTTLMDAVLSFFPEEDRVKYSAMTGQSLYYLGETNLKHKILAVVEEAGAEKASYALKLLQSEGELTIASTGKDPTTGKMVTQEYHVEGPVMIFLTTTAIDLDEELQNRCLTLAVDESAAQTERIHRVQRERRTLAGLLAHEQRKDLLTKLRNAQRLLSPLAVVNPFAPALTFATARTRNRRDHEKYLTLIDAIALLHQHQREAKPLPNAPAGAPLFIEATLDDIALANELAPEVLGRSLDELPPQTRRLLAFIRELMKAKRKEQKAAKVGAGPACFSRRELRDLCGWSLTQVRVHLERLVELEYLATRHARLNNQFLYEALFDVDTPEAVAHVGLIAVETLRQTQALPNSPATAERSPSPGGEGRGEGEPAPAKLTSSHDYTARLTGLDARLAGQNGRLAAVGASPPPAVLANASAGF
jgi:hypothetical protein